MDPDDGKKPLLLEYGEWKMDPVYLYIVMVSDLVQLLPVNLRTYTGP